MLFDGFVEQRLRDGGIIHFAVTVPAIAEHVYDYVRAERVAIFESDAADADHGIHIFSVHVKDGDRLASGKLRSEARRMRFAGNGSEADQIVGNDVYGSTHGVAGQVGIVQSLGDNALS